jgi:hypothetical protein
MIGPTPGVSPGRSSQGAHMILERVNVLSVAKVMAILYAVLGLIVGAVVSIVALVAGAAALAGGEGHPIFGLLFGIGSIVFFPILYGLLGAILWSIGAALYNLVSRLTGGIELDLAPRSR